MDGINKLETKTKMAFNPFDQQSNASNGYFNFIKALCVGFFDSAIGTYAANLNA